VCCYILSISLHCVHIHLLIHPQSICTAGVLVLLHQVVWLSWMRWYLVEAAVCCQWVVGGGVRKRKVGGYRGDHDLLF
jgi:hypothetical protein